MKTVRLSETLRKWSNGLYWRLGAVVVPGLENSQFPYARLLRATLAERGRWLDVGCGHDVFPPWFPQRHRQIDLPVSRGVAVGIDLDLAALRRHSLFRLRTQGDIQALPFCDGAFDLVTANMVLEHVEEPAALFREVSRVLAPGGRFVVHTPNASGYTTLLTKLVPRRARSRVASLIQGREPCDVYPTHYRANSDSALKALGSSSGLTMRRLTYVQSSPQMTLIPILTLIEMLFIRVLYLERLSRWRPCLLAELEKTVAVKAV